MTAIPLPHYEGYTVDVLKNAPHVGPNNTRRIIRILVAVVLALSGIIATGFGSPARAGWIDDGVKSVFCTSVFTNSTADALWGTPMTVRGKDLSKYPMTAYEKYGVSGLGYTVWVGPDSADDLKTNGTSAKQLTGLAGGEGNTGGLTDWKQSKDDAFFNYDETCGDPTNAAWSTGANALTLVTAGVVYVTGFTFQVAYESSSSILGAMQQGTGGNDGVLPKLVSTLTDSLYLEFFNIMVMLAAIWMGYKGLVKRQSTEMAQGAVWMFGAAIVGMFMLANPLMVSNAVNTAVMTVSEAGVSAIATPSTKALTGSDSDGLCYTNVAGNGADAKGDALKTSTRGIVRGMQCSLWESFLYTPWTQGQFGHLEGDTAPNGVNYIVGTTGQPGQYGVLAKETPALKDAALPKTISMGGRDIPANWARLQLDSKVSHRLDEGDSAKLTLKQGRTMLEIASSQTMRSNPNIAWTGKTSINRVFLSILALVSALGAGVMVMVLSMEMIILQIGLILLALLLPVFALVGVHPGFGRRVALRYFNTIGELTVRRIVLSSLLAVMVTVYAVVLRTATTMSWMVAMVMVVAVSIAGIAYKNKVMGMFEGAMNVGGVGAANLRGVNAMTDRSLLYAAKQGKRGAKQAARPVNAVGRGVLAVGAGAGTALVSNAMRQESSIDTAKMGGGAGTRPKRSEVESETPTNKGSSAYVPKQRDADGPQGTPVVKGEGNRGSEGGSGARVDIQKHSEREPHIEDAHAPVMARVDAQSPTNPLPEVRRDEAVNSAPQTTVQGAVVTPVAMDAVTTAPEVRRDGSAPVSDKTVVSTPEASSKDGQTATPRMDGLPELHPEQPQGAQLGGAASQRPAGLPELHPEHDGMFEDVPVRQLHEGGRAGSLPTWTALVTDAQDTPEQLASPRVQKVAPEQSKAVDSDAETPVAQQRPATDSIQGVPQRTSEAAQGTAGEQQVHTTSRVVPVAQKATQQVSRERQTTAGDVGSPEQHAQGNTAAETASTTSPQAPVRPSGEAFRARAEKVVGPAPVKPGAARRAWGDFAAGAQGSRGKGLKVVSRSVQQRKRDVAREQRALSSWEWQVGKVQSELRSAWNAEDPTTYPDALPEKPEDDGETRKK